MTRPLRGLTNGPITPTLIRFATPLLVTGLLHTVVGTWNAVWVSQILGPAELIAVVNANVMLGILMALVSGFGVAAGVFVGQSVGADDFDTAKRFIGTAMTIAVGAGTMIALVGFFGVESMVDLLRMPEETRVSSIIYFRIFCLAMPALFVFVFSTMILRSAGDARTPFIFSGIWIVLGFILTPLLMTGIFGLPKLGIAGAAWGGLIANATALLALLIYVYRKDLILALHGKEIRYLIPDPGILLRLAKRAIPSAAESIIVQGSYFVLLTFVNGYGVATAAAYSAAAQLWGYVQLPAMTIAASMSSMAAQNIGANQWDRVNKIALRGCALGFTSTALVAATIYALGDLPLRLFLPDGGEPLRIAMQVNAVVLWSFTIIAVTFGLFAIVRANGVMLPSAIIFAITLWGLRVPFANFFQEELGSAAIWWSFPIGTIASAIFAFGYYHLGRWREHAPLNNNPKIKINPESGNDNSHKTDR